MVKYKISEFTIEYGEHSTRGSGFPLSVASVLEDRGASAESFEARFTSEFILEDVALSSKYIYIRLSDVHGAFVLLINGVEAGRSLGPQTAYSFDIRQYVAVGRNTLELVFEADSRAALMESGIFGPVTVARFNHAMIDRVLLEQKHDGGAVTLGVKLSVVGTTEGVRAVATLVSDAGQVYYGGITRGRGTITVKNPLYWYPRGQGVQNLYKFTLNLYGDMEVEDTHEIRIGLRSVSTVNSAEGSLIDVNGAQFVPMGAVYRPPHGGRPELDRRLTEAHLMAATAQGFNSLVIPADIPALPAYFYDICDYQGLAVIHEVVELNEGETARLSRVAHHPSVVLVDVIGSGDRIEEIADELRKICPDTDFCLYEGGARYPSEEAICSYSTLARLLPAGELNLFSEGIEAAGRERIVEMFGRVSEEYLYPSDLSRVCYAAEIVAAERLDRQIMRARLARGARGRAVYGEISPTSDVMSKSSIGPFGEWRAAHYYSKTFFAPIAVYAEADGTSVAFSVSNESRRDFVGEIEYRIIDKHNRLIYSKSEPCDVARASAKSLFIRDLSEVVSGHEREYYLEYYLRDGSSVLSRRTLLFCPPKRFDFAKPTIKAEVAGADKHFTLTLTSDVYARDVEVASALPHVLMLDNYIDITSGAPVKLSFVVTEGIETVEGLQDSFSIRSVCDIGNP